VGPFLVFEYVEGHNLKDSLRNRGALPPEEVLALAEQVGAALEVAHREGIIHRDIKPENLLVGSDGLIRLADFGVARVPDAALTGRGQFLGTPCYGAPETLTGGEAGPLSDQFSFAAVLYEAASGVRAFPGTDALAVAHAVIHSDPPPPSQVAQPGARVPAALDAVLLRALRKEPSARYETLSVLLSALRAAYFESGFISRTALLDTLPAVAMAERRASTLFSSRADPRASTADVAGPSKRSLALWPFALALLFGLGVVLKLVPAQLGGLDERGDAAPATDADGVQRVEGPRSSAPPAPQKALAPAAVPADAGHALAAEAADAAVVRPPNQLSAFEREERAKDALDRAQRALEAGQREQAKAALDEAFLYDPEHPDIPALRQKL
jgi:serine/threonine-protein kinase